VGDRFLNHRYRGNFIYTVTKVTDSHFEITSEFESVLIIKGSGGYAQSYGHDVFASVSKGDGAYARSYALTKSPKKSKLR
jgi:hypothetical protein